MATKAPLGTPVDGRESLLTHGRRVDEELAADGIAGGIVLPPVDAGRIAVLGSLRARGSARPDDDEVAEEVRRDVRVRLIPGRVGVDEELRSQSRSAGVEAAGEHVRAARSVGGARPGDDEFPAAVRGDRRTALIPVVVVLTWKSPDSGTPAALKRRANTPSPEPSCPSSVQATTKPSFPPIATAGPN